MDIIRKIIIGDNPKNAMAYYVGMSIGESEVCNIQFDERTFHMTGNICYVIYISTPDVGIMRWKKIDKCPVIVEYDCKFN